MAQFDAYGHMATTDIAGTHRRNLGRLIGNLEAHRVEVKGAIDFLQGGF